MAAVIGFLHSYRKPRMSSFTPASALASAGSWGGSQDAGMLSLALFLSASHTNQYLEIQIFKKNQHT